LDVAAVADQWWRNSSALRLQLRQSSQCETEEQAYAWLMFFICLHDLGKLDIRFQMKSSEAIEQLQPENYTLIKAKFDYKSYMDTSRFASINCFWF
jgi:CRISPR-associated endonuclease/helicase Cas3